MKRLAIAAAAALMIVVIPAATATGSEGGVVPVADREELPAPLGVDPACPPAIKVGMRNLSDKARFADMRVEVEEPLRVSRPVVSSYLAPGYELLAKLLVTVPDGTAPGTFELRLTAGEETLTVPVKVMPLDELDNGGNWALRRPATASSFHAAYYPPCGAVDGDNTSSGWGGGNGWNDNTSRQWPDTFDVAFGKVREIDRVDLYTLDTDRYPAEKWGLRDWDIQVRAGDGWATVAQVRGNTEGTVRSEFAAVETDAIRIVTLNSNSGDYSRITEVEAYGPG